MVMEGGSVFTREAMSKGGRKTVLPPLNELGICWFCLSPLRRYHSQNNSDQAGLLLVQKSGSLKWRIILNAKLTYYNIVIQQALATWI